MSDNKGQGHRVKTQVTRFRTVTPVCLYISLTYGYEMMHIAWCGTGEMPCCFPRSSAIFQGHTDRKSHIWCTGRFRTVTAVWTHRWLLNDARSLKKCHNIFHGHVSKFKFTRDNKLPIFTRIARYRIVTPVRIQRNNAQRLTSKRWDALFVFNVIYQISRSRVSKNRRFWS